VIATTTVFTVVESWRQISTAAGTRRRSNGSVKCCTIDPGMDEAPDALEYFSGGVPTGEAFRGILEEIDAISAQQEPAEFIGINRLQELCFIGLLSYFESFCKDHFASVINLQPELVQTLKAAGQDVSVDASHVALLSSPSMHRIGFLLASKYDFGTSQKINSLFGALLKITPFGKADVVTFDRLLLDRHLLVHHGGTYTVKYLEQTGAVPKADAGSNAFYNSRTIGRENVVEAIAFIGNIARTLLRSSHERLVTLVDTKSDDSGELQKVLD
jgi:hypothetical protein